MLTCSKCGRTLDDVNFYKDRSGKHAELCKQCLTMHIDPFNPETYVWIMEKMDFPYVPGEWNVLVNRDFAKKGAKITGMGVFGKYVSKMKLKQFKDFGWADSEELQKQADDKQNAEIKNAEEFEKTSKQRLENGEISEAEYKTLTSAATQMKNEILERSQTLDTDLRNTSQYNENNFVAVEDIPDLSADLTEEDKTYLLMKWGRLYTPNEWITLEKDYNEMMNSFDIQDADTKNTLLLICKTNLKMNQSLDQGDIEAYQKLSKVSNDLRKSAKFTAAQKKDKEAEDFDCVGAIVNFCEKEGGAIPRYDGSADPDLVDTLINNLKDYNRSLVDNDANLAQQIERYLKLLEINLQKKADKEKAKAEGKDYVELSDADIIEYNNMIAEQIAQDEEGDI